MDSSIRRLQDGKKQFYMIYHFMYLKNANEVSDTALDRRIYQYMLNRKTRDRI